MRFDTLQPGKLLVPDHKLIVRGKYHGLLIRTSGEQEEFDFDNIVVNEGMNDLLNTYLNGGSQLTSWFMGIFQGNYTPVPTDTAATIAANSTECSSYTNPTRPQWTPASPASQQITNTASPSSFTFNEAQTIYGAFLVSNNVIAGSAGKLFSAAQFAAPKGVDNGDQLLLTYSFGVSST